MLVEEYHNALEQAITLEPYEVRYAGFHTDLLVEAVWASGKTPHYGGSYREHFEGKIAELGFWVWLRENQVRPIHTTFRPWYTSLDSWDDFMLLSQDGEKIHVEVKSGVTPLGTAMNLPINNFGMPVPEEQIEKLADVDFLVYMLVDPGYSRVAPIGYCEGVDLREYRVKRSIPHPAVIVPITDLSPLSGLLQLVKMVSRLDEKSKQGIEVVT